MSVRGAAPSRRSAHGAAEPAGEAQPQADARAALADLARLVIRSGAPQLWLRLGAAFVFTLLGKGLGVWAPLLLGAAVNRLAAERGAEAGLTGAFVALAVGWALTRFLAGAAPQLRDALFTAVGQAAQRKAAAETFAHALSLSVDYHQTKRTGSLARTLERGARAVDFLLRVLVFNLAPTVLELLLAAVVLWLHFDWRFALVAVVTVGVYGVLTFAISDWRIQHRRELNEADAEAAGRSVDALINYETVKAFGAEARAAADYERALASYADAAVKSNSSLALLNAVQSLIMSAGLGIMAVLAGLGALAGRMGPGDVTAAVLIMVSVYQPLNILGFAYREIRQSFIDMEAMTALRRREPDIADAPDAADLRPGADPRGAELTFDRVGFRHSARSAGLEQVSFTAEPGTTTALVGPSGAGKSTIVRLALRLLEPQAGAVRLDGQDLRAVKQASLRRAIGLVPQDVALFNDTLRANIRFARPEASDADVEAVAEAAELGDFIRGLPDGLETRVGERGLKLSGGERQRVGIARALMAQPRLLILDEATSALDGRTEAAIQATLRKVRAGRTTLVVAHRLSTIADADQILVLKAGRIVERGRHAELLALDGEYAALWRRQINEPEAGSRQQAAGSDESPLVHLAACCLLPASFKERLMNYLHTMVRVRDLDASLAFYCGALGLEEVRRTENPGGRFTLVFLAAPGDVERVRAEGAPTVELTYNWDPEDYGGGRNFGHLAYRVPDIHAACERLAAAGVTINRPPRDGRMAFVRSPDGVSVELLQDGPALTPSEPWASMPNVGSW